MRIPLRPPFLLEKEANHLAVPLESSGCQGRGLVKCEDVKVWSSAQRILGSVWRHLDDTAGGVRASGGERAIGATEGCLAQNVSVAKVEEPCAQELSGFGRRSPCSAVSGLHKLKT